MQCGWLAPALIALAMTFSATGAKAGERLSEPLPATAPAPTENPERQDESAKANEQNLPESSDAPLPKPSPHAEPDAGATPVPSEPESAAAPAGSDGAPAGNDPAPIPAPRPDSNDQPEGPESHVPAEKAYSGPALPAAMSAEDKACRVRLAELGVKFDERPSQSDPSGCLLPFPVAVTELGGVSLAPEALVTCALAETTARFVADVVKPETQRTFRSPLTAIRQDSGYVCRPRAGTDTLSEHAYGRAIDFGAFTLADGREIAVEKTEDSEIGRYFARLRKAACGPFKTVLGPGSDADHATHFHFDLAERRNGSAYCR